jgi:hypothetical protein
VVAVAQLAFTLNASRWLIIAAIVVGLFVLRFVLRSFIRATKLFTLAIVILAIGAFFVVGSL